MSTRCNILVKDVYKDEMWFYRHSDGYPSGALPPLIHYMYAVSQKVLRNNVGQSAGWLILLGAKEYARSYNYKDMDNLVVPFENIDEVCDPFVHKEWKCGSIEPTDGEHGDIEYLYTLKLETGTIEYHDTLGYDGETEVYVKLGIEEIETLWQCMENIKEDDDEQRRFGEAFDESLKKVYKDDLHFVWTEEDEDE